MNTQPGGGVYAGGIGGSPASFTANNNVDHTHGLTISGETGNEAGHGDTAPAAGHRLQLHHPGGLNDRADDAAADPG